MCGVTGRGLAVAGLPLGSPELREGGDLCVRPTDRLGLQRHGSSAVTVRGRLSVPAVYVYTRTLLFKYFHISGYTFQSKSKASLCFRGRGTSPASWNMGCRQAARPPLSIRSRAFPNSAGSSDPSGHRVRFCCRRDLD